MYTPLEHHGQSNRKPFFKFIRKELLKPNCFYIIRTMLSISDAE